MKRRSDHLGLAQERTPLPSPVNCLFRKSRNPDSLPNWKCRGALPRKCPQWIPLQGCRGIFKGSVPAVGVGDRTIDSKKISMDCGILPIPPLGP